MMRLCCRIRHLTLRRTAIILLHVYHIIYLCIDWCWLLHLPRFPQKVIKVTNVFLLLISYCISITLEQDKDNHKGTSGVPESLQNLVAIPPKILLTSAHLKSRF